MARTKARETGESEQTPTAEEEEITPAFDLEPMTDDMRSRLNVWGNSTLLTIDQLRPAAPGWASLMQSLFDAVRETIEVMSQ